MSFHPESSERSAAALAELLGCQGLPQGVRDGVLLGGVNLGGCEVVEEAQCLGLESSGCGGDHRHEPVLLSLKPLVVLGHLGASRAGQSFAAQRTKFRSKRVRNARY